MSAYGNIRAAQAEAAITFGKMLRRWRIENGGWTQYTAKRWADEAGHPSQSHSGLSELENGLVKHPRTSVFMALGEMNARIAAQDFSGVRSRDLRDLLSTARPILDEDGTPWGPAQFWECHAGIRPVPAHLAPAPSSPAPQLGEQAAADLCSSWAEQARELVRSKGGKPADLLRAGAAAPPRHREQWGLVVMGLSSYSPEQLQATWDEEASEWAPAQWLAAWAATLDPSGGGGLSRNCGLGLAEGCNSD